MNNRLGEITEDHAVKYSSISSENIKIQVAKLRDYLSEHLQLNSTDCQPVKGVAEVALLFELSGLEGPWLSQYARTLNENVAILNLTQSQIAVSIVTADAVAKSDRFLHLANQPHRGIHDLVTKLDGEIDRWIIRLTSPQLARDIEILHAIERWTLVASASNLAMVNVYSQLKQLLSQSSAMCRPQVGVMVMGTETVAAQAFTKRLSLTTKNFLGRDLKMVGVVPRMKPVTQIDLGSFRLEFGDCLGLVGRLTATPSEADPTTH